MVLEEKNWNRIVTTLLTILMFGLYAAYIVWLFWCQPFVACAAEKEGAVPGGMGNTVVVSSEQTHDSNKSVYEITFQSKENYEIVGYLSPMISAGEIYKYNICFVHWYDNNLYPVRSRYLDDCTGSAFFYKNGEMTGSQIYSMSNICDSLGYKAGTSPWTIKTTVTGCKIFESSDAAKAYFRSGSLDGMVNVNVDMGTFDKSIGYLHNLTRKPLQYGETDENGIPESFDDCFTWSDSYPEYDDTYLVEVRASCAVETKKWFGLSKGTVYNSDIRNLANGISYKDLEFIISLADERSVFSDFINEHMPDENSLKSFGAVGAYQFDVFYFRIYKWDEELNAYRYGEWVRLTRDGSPLTGTLESITDAGYFDKNGNWITDLESDYGEGKPGTDIVGTGNTQEEAKEDADTKEDQINSGDNKIDLSDTNFMELWEWFCKSLVSFWNGIGVIPEFFGRVFSFLPAPVIGFIGLGLAAAIILRVCGR